MSQGPGVKVGDRLSYVSKLLARAFPSGRGVIKDYQVRPGDPATGWFRLVFKLDDIVIHVFEFLSGGIVLKYAYTLLVKSEAILRYDNAPHHKGLPTFPHHKHVRGEVVPLEAPSIEEFVREAVEIVLEIERGGRDVSDALSTGNGLI